MWDAATGAELATLEDSSALVLEPGKGLAISVATPPCVTFNPDGALSEVTIVGAQPVGVFEQSALDAVRHWRFQPVVRAGVAVAQRARVRLRFAVQS